MDDTLISTLRFMSRTISTILVHFPMAVGSAITLRSIVRYKSRQYDA